MLIVVAFLDTDKLDFLFCQRGVIYGCRRNTERKRDEDKPYCFFMARSFRVVCLKIGQESFIFDNNK